VGVHHVNAREGDVLEPQERPWLDEVVLNGVAGCGGPGGDPELGIDRTHMCIDRRKTDHQLLGNLDVGLPHCQQAEDLVLAPGQSSRWGTEDFAAGTDGCPAGIGASIVAGP
jgi:hypothetical protein